MSFIKSRVCIEPEIYRTLPALFLYLNSADANSEIFTVKPAMRLLDANMALLMEANAPTPSVSNSTLGYTKVENGSVAGASGPADDYTFSNSHLSASGDFTSPSQYSFDTPYYPNQHSAEGSAATFSPLTDAQFHEFGAGIGNDSGTWSY